MPGIVSSSDYIAVGHREMKVEVRAVVNLDFSHGYQYMNLDYELTGNIHHHPWIHTINLTPRSPSNVSVSENPSALWELHSDDELLVPIDGPHVTASGSSASI